MSATQVLPAPNAAAAPCPDAELVFARGTTELPGTGPTGEAFVSSLRSQLGPKSLGVYAVDYPATTDFPTAIEGIRDARDHVLSTIASCPDAALVLGGFSQGAAVIGFLTSSVVPDGVSPQDVPAPMPAEAAERVAAVVLFGKPSVRFMKAIRDPDVVVGPNYAAKAIELCVDNDLVCDPHGRSFSAHNQYMESGLVDQGASFVAQRLQAVWAVDTTEPSTPTPALLSTPAHGLASANTPSSIDALPGPAPLPGPAA
uniref:cutinase family protein n=1 Tax=unclassified Mycolicibacterium TaxID=2636767 RepID=UPI0032E9D531